jgi:hypothetical protein
VYCSAANTQYGIYVTEMGIALNNIIEGWSGAGGVALRLQAGTIISAGNAYFNNTSNESDASKFHMAVTPNDALAASAWVSAATGNFSINGVIAGVTEDGYPLVWPGLTTSTAPKPDKGAVQSSGVGV